MSGIIIFVFSGIAAIPDRRPFRSPGAYPRPVILCVLCLSGSPPRPASCRSWPASCSGCRRGGTHRPDIADSGRPRSRHRRCRSPRQRDGLPVRGRRFLLSRRNELACRQRCGFRGVPWRGWRLSGRAAPQPTRSIFLRLRSREGTVRLCGDDLRDLRLHDIRDYIGLALQEPALFSTSVRDNIAFGRPKPAMTTSSPRQPRQRRRRVHCRARERP